MTQRLILARDRPRPLLLGFLVVLAACGGPSPSPSALATGASEPSEEAPSEPAASQPAPSEGAVIAPPAEREPVTAADFIDLAVAEGRISPETGVLYGVYAHFGDPMLPEEFHGEWTDDASVLSVAMEEFDTYSAETQAALRPYLVRPSDPESTWSTLESDETAVTATLASVQRRTPDGGPLAQGPCVDNWYHETAGNNVPVMVWTRCVGGVPSGRSIMDLVKGFMEDLWLPMTEHMGEPIGDANVADDDYPDTPENGDGLIDIYIVSNFATATPRRILTLALASAPDAPPFVGRPGVAASSGYMVVSARGDRNTIELKSTIAHEFFHILQSAHNSQGLYQCPNGATCPPTKIKAHWFTEASATWSEHEFVPEGRAVAATGPYARYDNYRISYDALSSLAGTNQYDSWAWPLFMEQELGASAIADAWSAIEGQRGFAALQRAVNSVLPFSTAFDDFAVRVWNQQLQGDPISPRFNDPRLDPDFPTTQPEGLRASEEITISPDSRSLTVNEGLHPLWSVYRPLAIGSGTRLLTLDFSGWNPSSFGAEALVRLESGEWERRTMVLGSNEWCLDVPADAITDLIVIPYHHDAQATAPITGAWTATANRTGCADVTGTITYSSTYIDPGGMEGTLSENVTVSVVTYRGPGRLPVPGWVHQRRLGRHRIPRGAHPGSAGRHRLSVHDERDRVRRWRGCGGRHHRHGRARRHLRHRHLDPGPGAQPDGLVRVGFELGDPRVVDRGPRMRGAGVAVDHRGAPLRIRLRVHECRLDLLGPGRGRRPGPLTPRLCGGRHQRPRTGRRG